MALPGILQQLAMANPMTGQIKQMMSMVQSAQNPQAMLNQMMQNNPQMQQAMKLINQHGGDAQKAFYSLAQERGIDPQEILKMLK